MDDKTRVIQAQASEMKRDASSMLLVGTTLQMGKYRIDRYLSSGGFGNTYEATNLEFEERVAIKEFFMKGITERDTDTESVSVSNLASKPVFDEQLNKFKKEARRLRKLKSDYIVQVHDLFEENGTAYYVMDFIEGESLKERLEELNRPLTEEEVKKFLPQILKALEDVHRQRIWHLDIKPANIMVDADNNARLVDFGASKQMKIEGGGATTNTAPSYTAGYAPSEQIDGRMDLVGNWTDIYGLGATIYRLLSGNKPPMLSDIISDKERAFNYPQPVSPEMQALVVWMMQVDRTKRPQNVDEIREFISQQGGMGMYPPAMPKMPEPQPDSVVEESVVEDHPIMPPLPPVSPAPESEPEFEPESAPETELVQPSETAPESAPETELEQPSETAPESVPETELEQPSELESVPESEPEPTAEPEPISDSEPQPAVEQPAPDQPKKGGKKTIALFAIGGIVLGLIIGSIVLFLKKGNHSASDSSNDQMETVTNQPAWGVYQNGDRQDTIHFTYTGPLTDGKPNGQGKGSYDMGDYEGNYVNGLRQGQGKFSYTSGDGKGDTFVGTFNQDMFESGEYHDIDVKQIYKGDFKDGNFNNGEWINEDGSHFATVVNGQEK